MTTGENKLATDDQDVFINLYDLLAYPRKVSVPSLATAIELHGIWGSDEYGRFRHREGKSDMAAKALSLLARVNKEDDGPRDSLPLVEKYDPDNPLWHFAWPSGELPDFEPLKAGQGEREDKPYTPRERANRLALIGALLEFINRGKDKADQIHDSTIMNWFEGRYPGIEGLSKSTLEKVFPDAKRALGIREPQKRTPTSK